MRLHDRSAVAETRTISTLVLACGVGFGLLLCYLLAIPFIPALVGAFTLSVLFAPLD